jgi:hypothetical protein
MRDRTPPTETDGPPGAAAVARSLHALGKQRSTPTSELGPRLCALGPLWLPQGTQITTTRPQFRRRGRFPIAAASLSHDAGCCAASSLQPACSLRLTSAPSANLNLLCLLAEEKDIDEERGVHSSQSETSGAPLLIYIFLFRK